VKFPFQLFLQLPMREIPSWNSYYYSSIYRLWSIIRSCFHFDSLTDLQGADVGTPWSSGRWASTEILHQIWRYDDTLDDVLSHRFVFGNFDCRFFTVQVVKDEVNEVIYSFATRALHANSWFNHCLVQAATSRSRNNRVCWLEKQSDFLFKNSV
jgi:hypothetical protein